MSEVTAVNPLSDTRVNTQTGDEEDEISETQNDKEVLKSVDELLDLVTIKFTKISNEMNAKMDEMAQRLDELEASIKAGTHVESESESVSVSSLLEPLKQPSEELELEPLEPLEVEFSRRPRRGS